MIRIFTRLTTLTLLITLLAACSPGTAGPPTSAATSTSVSKMTQHPSPSITPVPSQTPVTQSAAASAPPDWKTYTNSNLHVALEYPPDWSLSEETSGAVFTSPQGLTVTLAKVETGGLSAQEFINQNQLPNTRCSRETNPAGVLVDNCFDTIAFSTNVYLLVKLPQGAQELLSLTSLNRNASKVLSTMAATVRPAPGS